MIDYPPSECGGNGTRIERYSTRQPGHQTRKARVPDEPRVHELCLDLYLT